MSTESAIQRGRMLTPAASSAILAFLRNHPLPATLIVHSNDREAERLRDQLATIFSSQKSLSRGDIQTFDLLGAPAYPPGVELLYRSKPLAYKADVDRLQSILNKFGVKATVAPTDPTDWQPGIEIHVGANPASE